MSTTVRHPIFARMYGRIDAYDDAKGGAEYRTRLLAGSSGRVIEVGAGLGANFPHYASDVVEVVAVEPEPYLRQRATNAARRAHVAVRVIDGAAERLPVEEATFDVGVASLVLCSVKNQALALAELYRVIRPGGELRFYEHVRAGDARTARMQDWVNHVWPYVGGGCNCNRDTESAISGAGFEIEVIDRFRFQPCVIAAPVAPMILGTALRP